MNRRLDLLTFRQAWLVLGGFVCLFLLTSCGASSDSSDSTDSGNPIIRAMADDPDLSDFQVGLLSDGVLTFAEYEQAVFRTATCLEENGFVEIELELVSETRGYNIAFGYPGGTVTTKHETNHARCFEESLSAVESAFVETNRPAAEATLAKQMDCARDILIESGEHTDDELGAMTPELLTEALVIDARRVYNCANRP